jgi:hypothetical protein
MKLSRLFPKDKRKHHSIFDHILEEFYQPTKGSCCPSAGGYFYGGLKLGSNSYVSDQSQV